MMKRRTFLTAGAAVAGALAAPRIARSQESKTLRFIPQVDLPLLDPVTNSAYITRNHGFAVYDTLFGQDSAYAPQPQMVDGFTTEQDGKLWRLVLRDGLKFHDNTQVLARDCVASVQRWGKRDAFGQALMAATDEISAADDKTIVFRLKRPFPLLPAALGKVASNMCPMMPERLAKTDPFGTITDATGSGPFRYIAAERVPGARVVYERFDGYVPRPGGTPDWTAGPKIAYVDRVEWTVIPDASTAAAALKTKQVDWWQEPAFDLLSLLKQDGNIAITELDPTGLPAMMRFNHLQPPFNNPAIRRALLGAVDQAEFMQAVAGDDPTLWKADVGYFPPSSPMAGQVGMEALEGKRDLAKVKRDLAAAGYNNERVVVMVATDLPALNALGLVGADMLTHAGMNVDVQSTDWGSVIQRRASREPVEKGGWSVFFTSFYGLDEFTPATHLGLRGNGAQGWFGWADSPRLESLRDAWLRAPDLAAQKAIATQIQAQAFIDVPYLPLGAYFQPTATRKSLTGVLKGLPLFWNVKKEA
jgi:peptide/nickel transport system substrate-binding protein